MAEYTLISYAFGGLSFVRPLSDLILQYILGSCTWYGLSTIGEPPLTKSLVGGGQNSSSIMDPIAARKQVENSQVPMPGWLIIIFFALGATRYIGSFLFSYVYQVIAAVVMVSSDDISSYEAAMAIRRPTVPRPAAKQPSVNGRPLRKIGTFRPVPLSKKNRSLTRSLTRSVTMPIQSLGKRFFGLTCLRGLNAFLIMSVAQWYLGAISDFFLSGQPKELMPGYGSSSVILAVFWGGGYAMWTHYAITEPSNRDIYRLFPRGSEILVELFPITCLWAVCDQVSLSLPLAMSRIRSFELRKYAWNPKSWNELDAHSQRLLLFKFGLVYLFYLVLVAGLSIPATMMLRRIHASMLPEANAAIVPYTRGSPQPRDDDDESETHSPGLTVGEAWSTLKWSAYIRVVGVFVQYFLINQLLRFLCWEANWRLHEFFQTDQYAARFPSGPTKLSLRIFE